MLLDSNVIIYAAKPAFTSLRQFIADHAPAVSFISYIEVLGYHQLSEPERAFLEQFFQATEVLPMSDPVVQWAVKLRQRRRVTLGDAIVDATALAQGWTLVTRKSAIFLGLTN